MNPFGVTARPESSRRQLWVGTLAQIQNYSRLLEELRMEIIDLITSKRMQLMRLRPYGRDPSDGKDPSKPPEDGSCPFIEKLPTELRRSILAASLPNKGVVIEPACATVPVKKADDWWEEVKKPKNQISDLMRLCKTLKQDVSEVVYEERTFAIHVHEGFFDGGIEFVNIGRQPLQYVTKFDDKRFSTKIQECNEFGFSRLKRINITIFPGDGEKHTAINTYFMNLALATMLDCGRDSAKKRITHLYIHVKDAGPLQRSKSIGHTSTNQHSTYWWDADRSRPSESSIHGVSDMELVLLPFANLSSVHNVEIQLPHSL